MNDVSLSQGRDVQQVERLDGEIRSDQLKGKRDHIHEGLRERNHEEQEEQRERQDPKDIATE